MKNGMTYHEDVAAVKDSFKKMLENGVYKADLFSDLDHIGVRPYEVCYPTSKRAAENLCASYSKQYGMETVVVRPCHTYGPSITPTDNRANVQFISRNVLV